MPTFNSTYSSLSSTTVVMPLLFSSDQNLLLRESTSVDSYNNLLLIDNENNMDHIAPSSLSDSTHSAVDESVDNNYYVDPELWIELFSEDQQSIIDKADCFRTLDQSGYSFLTSLTSTTEEEQGTSADAILVNSTRNLLTCSSSSMPSPVPASPVTPLTPLQSFIDPIVTTSSTTTTAAKTTTTTTQHTPVMEVVGKKRKRNTTTTTIDDITIPAAKRRLAERRKQNRREKKTNSTSTTTTTTTSTTPVSITQDDFIQTLQKQLIQAARAGDLNQVRHIFESSADSPSESSRTLLRNSLLGSLEHSESALYNAIFYNRYEVAEYLLEIGANVNLTTRSGVTPLYLAVDRGHLNLLPLLNRYNADPNLHTAEGLAIIHRIVRNADVTSLRHILTAIPSDRLDLNLTTTSTPNSEHDNASPLMLAILLDLPEIATILLEAGAALVPSLQQAALRSQSTALHLAVTKNKTQLLEILLTHASASAQHHAVNVADSLGRTALHYAVYWNRLDAVRILMKNGASTSQKDRFQKTPIDLAQRHNSPAVLELLTSTT